MRTLLSPALVAVLVLVGCGGGADYDLQSWYALAQTTAKDMEKTQETSQEIFEDLEYDSAQLTRYDLSSGKEETVCFVTVKLDKKRNLPLGNVTYDCDNEIDKKQAEARARSKVRSELLMNQGTRVPADLLEDAADWSADAAALTLIADLWDADFDLKECVHQRLALNNRIFRKNAQEQCHAFLEPGARLDAYLASLSSAVSDQERALARVTGDRPTPELEEDTEKALKAAEGKSLPVGGTLEVSLPYEGRSSSSFSLRDGERIEIAMESTAGRVRAELFENGKTRRSRSTSLALGKKDKWTFSASKDGAWVVVFSGIDKKNDGGSITVTTTLKRKAGGLDDKAVDNLKQLVAWVGGLAKEENQEQLLLQWRTDEASSLALSCLVGDLLDESKQAVSAITRPIVMSLCLDEARDHLAQVRARAILDSQAEFDGDALDTLIYGDR